MARLDLTLAVSAALALTHGVPVAAAPAAPATTNGAVIATLEAVCRPSTEANVRPEVSVTRLGYPSVAVPPNLPTGKPLHAWLAPGPGPGKIYVLDGGLPESAQAGCIVAVYGEQTPTLPGDIQSQIKREKAGFQPNPLLAVSSPRQTVVRFERRKGAVVTSILVIQAKAAAPDQPSSLVVVSRANYGWLDKFGG